MLKNLQPSWLNEDISLTKVRHKSKTWKIQIQHYSIDCKKAHKHRPINTKKYTGKPKQNKSIRDTCSMYTFEVYILSTQCRSMCNPKTILIKVKNLKMNAANYCLKHNHCNFENIPWDVAVKKIRLTNFIMEQDSWKIPLFPLFRCAPVFIPI